jgi:hypothetical protein
VIRALLTLTVVVVGCTPVEPSEPLPDQGQEALPAALCVGNGDGILSPDEVPSVDLSLSVRSTFLVAPTGTSLPAGWQDDGFDLSLGRLPTQADSELVFSGPESLDGAWFAGRFADGEWQTVLDFSTGTRGVFARQDDAVVLLGIASTEPGEIAVVYTPPVPMFALPMTDGDSWEVAADATGLANGSTWPEDLGADGVVSLVHRWSFEVDGGGVVALPAADLPVLRLRLVLRTEAYNSIAGLFAADAQRAVFLVAECLGTVARLRSEPDELDEDFVSTTEILRFGLAPELLP